MDRCNWCNHEPVSQTSLILNGGLCSVAERMTTVQPARKRHMTTNDLVIKEEPRRLSKIPRICNRCPKVRRHLPRLPAVGPAVAAVTLSVSLPQTSFEPTPTAKLSSTPGPSPNPPPTQKDRDAKVFEICANDEMAKGLSRALVNPRITPTLLGFMQVMNALEKRIFILQPDSSSKAL